jgi:hypothetical protein
MFRVLQCPVTISALPTVNVKEAYEVTHVIPEGRIIHCDGAFDEERTVLKQRQQSDEKCQTLDPRDSRDARKTQFHECDKALPPHDK